MLTGQQTKIVYSPDGGQTEFAVPFRFFEAGDLRVCRVEGDGRESSVLSGFSVSAAAAGGTVTFARAPQAGGKLVISRATPMTQQTAYPEGGKFPSVAVETDFDRLTAIVQELAEAVNRAVRVDLTQDSALAVPEFYAQLDARALASAAAAATAAKAAAEAVEAAEEAARCAVLLEQGAGQATATEDRAGVVKVGEGLAVDAEGRLSALAAGTGGAGAALAFGRVSASGDLVSGRGLRAVSRLAAGSYQLTLADDHAFAGTDAPVVVAAPGQTSRFAVPGAAAGSSFAVNTYNTAFSAADAAFSFVVYKN